MFDAAARRLLSGPLDRAAAVIDRRWVSPDRITSLGLILGLGCAGSAAAGEWAVALVLWLTSRLADGLDGPLARRRAQGSGLEPSAAGGFYDIAADFTVYGATVVGVGLGTQGELWPFLAVLLAYYVNGTAFLAFSSLAERTGRRLDDGRSLSFIAGLAEGTETILVHAAWMIVPERAGMLAAGWAAVVGVGAVHRIWLGYRLLR
jgi:phosphatidylglycerophosphate synthase